MSSHPFDEIKAQAFAERMTDVLNNSVLALMISIGHRTKLFDTMAILPPATSAQIAEAAGLQERCVREWLTLMVTGEIIEHDPPFGTYALSPEHAASLTRAAAPSNLAATAQLTALLGATEDEIVDAFFHGCGVPYAQHSRFQEMLTEHNKRLLPCCLIHTCPWFLT